MGRGLRFAARSCGRLAERIASTRGVRLKNAGLSAKESLHVSNEVDRFVRMDDDRVNGSSQ
jgi:hypothetical protein